MPNGLMNCPNELISEMSFPFSCYDEFVAALDEVDILTELANQNEINEQLFVIYIKSSLLLLSAKFEAFLENVISEFATHLENIRLNSKHLPDIIKINSANAILNDDIILSIRQLNIRQKSRLEKVSDLFQDKLVESLTINTKFDYGKHGPREIIKLFRGIGIEDIFSECHVYNYNSLLGPAEVDMKGPINSVTNHRNQIIHNDLKPNITLSELWNYRICLNLFAEEIIEVLNKKLRKLLLFRTF